jgi:hypothetical protein
MMIVPIRSATNSGPSVGNVPALAGTIFFCPHRAGEHQVVEVGVAREPRERTAVVPGGRREGIEDLREHVRRPLGRNRTCLSRGGQHRDRREAEDRRGEDEDRDRGEFDVAALDLLAQVFRGSADHEAGDEDRDDREDHHAVETGADVTGRDLAELDEHQRDKTADRREAVHRRIDGTRARAGCRGVVERGLDGAETRFLAFHVAAG